MLSSLDMETIRVLTEKHETKSNLREVFHSILESPSSGFGSELQTKHQISKLFGNSHGITCSEFKGMEVSKRCKCAKKFKLSFRCLDEGHVHLHRSKLFSY